MLKKTRNLRLAALGALCAAAFLFAWENVQAVKLGYNIEKLRREIKDLESANTYLKKEIQVSLSPERLEAEAAKLGMVYPEPGAVVMLDGTPAVKKEGRGWLAKLLRLNKAS
jgi:cell division protein FtsL